MQGQVRNACQAATESGSKQACSIAVPSAGWADLQKCLEEERGEQQSEGVQHMMYTPFDKSTFVKAVPKDGSEALTVDLIKEVLVTIVGGTLCTT